MLQPENLGRSKKPQDCQFSLLLGWACCISRERTLHWRTDHQIWAVQFLGICSSEEPFCHQQIISERLSWVRREIPEMAEFGHGYMQTRNPWTCWWLFQPPNVWSVLGVFALICTWLNWNKVWISPFLVGGLEHFFFPYIGNNHPNWLSYFSEGFKPPTRFSEKGSNRNSRISLPEWSKPGRALSADLRLLWGHEPGGCHGWKATLTSLTSRVLVH